MSQKDVTVAEGCYWGRFVNERVFGYFGACSLSGAPVTYTISCAVLQLSHLGLLIGSFDWCLPGVTEML